MPRSREANGGQESHSCPPFGAARPVDPWNDSLPEAPCRQEFDDLARLAAQLSGAPVAVVAATEGDRLRFRACAGGEPAEIERIANACLGSVSQTRTEVLADPFPAEPRVRFYAGIPLRSSSGDIVGVLSVIDFVPRELDPDRLRALETLARMTARLLDLRPQVAVPGLEARVRDRTAALEQAVRASVRQMEERRRAEEAAREQHALLRQVIDANPNLLFIKDDEGRFVLANRAVGELYGVEPDDLIGKTDSDVSAGDEEAVRFRRRAVEIIEFDAEKLISEEAITDRKGDVRWFQTVKRPFVSGDGQVRYLMGTATDITARKQAERDWKRAQHDILRLHGELSDAHGATLSAYDATIEGWSRAMDLRDKETEGHSRRVADMTLRLARVFGFDEQQLVHVRRGALLHDIGKMGIPDQILLKPGPLTEEEWEIMRRHPVYAYEMLQPIEFLRPALAIPYAHHEKWDGTGYPRGLRGAEIPLEARLFAVVDVWDALSSDRPYRDAWPAEKVVAHLRALAGTHLDREVVQIFLALLASDGAVHSMAA